MFEWAAGYSGYVTPEREEFIRAIAARYWHVPYWDPMLDSPYYVNLALACKNVEAEVEDHLSRKHRN